MIKRDGLAVCSVLSAIQCDRMAKNTNPMIYRDGIDWYDLRTSACSASATSLVVLMLDGWRESKGVQLEIAEAKRLGMPVSYRGA